MEESRKWRWGKYRWVLLLVIILQIFFSWKYPPMLPHIQLPGEPVFSIGNFAVTNTLIATFLIDIVVLILVLLVQAGLAKGGLAPKGIAGAMDIFVEFIYNFTKESTGKWAKDVFPFFAAITIYVLIANWMELFPGVDSVGLLNLEHARAEIAAKGEEFKCITYAVLPGVTGVGGPRECSLAVIPVVRVASTDLNFTVALALFSVVMIQVMGVKANGPAYFLKFFNVTGIFSRPAWGFMDFLVSLLELISEFSKVLSFSFRLFGNIFAGSVLLFIVGSMVPVFAQSMVLMFEFFIGALQAVVFGMLTMIFMSMAVQGHGHAE